MILPTLYNYDLNEDCYRVRLLASCIGLGLKLVAVDEYPGREQLSSAFLALNPLGTLPILTDGDLTLTQTGSILLYLASTHDPEGRFLPEDPATMARMTDWLFFAANDLAPAIRARATALQSDVAKAASDIAAAKRAFRVLDDHLQRLAILEQGFVAGPEMTLADLTLFPSFALSRDYGLDHDTFPALRLWARRVRAVKGFITMPGIPDYH